VHLMDSSREKGIKLLIDVFHAFFFAKIGGDSIEVFMQYFL
jgi:sugar phosphate isomerase/epimerase